MSDVGLNYWWNRFTNIKKLLNCKGIEPEDAIANLNKELTKLREELRLEKEVVDLIIGVGDKHVNPNYVEYTEVIVPKIIKKARQRQKERKDL